ncbi:MULTISPECIES: TetR/AcrR family transcriptional regulator [unclassified Microbacterium]|uniref:TetR/AcrR family transcriptional regulator n=1 Tax=unclassified Microbacterium TaxID=2609290 RepID=UPI0030101353
MSGASGRAPGRRARATLTRSGILDAATRIVVAGGPAALTLRRLGTVLGADHTAVLRHFASKDEIVLAMAERMLDGAIADVAPGPDWAETFRDLARRLRRACLVQPAVAVLVATRITRSPAEFRGADLVLATLERAGFRGRGAVVLYRVLTDLVFAVSAYEASASLLDPESRAGDRLALGHDYLRASPAEYPHLAAAAPQLVGIGDDEVFETSLALVLDGLRFRLSTREAPFR